MAARREAVGYNYEGLNWDFLKVLAEIAGYSKDKYGSVEQYTESRLEGEKSPINHIAEHIRMYLAREKHEQFGDLEHQLGAIAYNAMMEFYYLKHGGPTVTDQLYREPEAVLKEIQYQGMMSGQAQAQPLWANALAPLNKDGTVQKLPPEPEPSTPSPEKSTIENLLSRFFGGGNSKESVQ
jgi:hypothetical protein